MTDNFLVVQNSVYYDWNKINFPTLDVDVYTLLPGNYHYISLGLFGYDTTYLQRYTS